MLTYNWLSCQQRTQLLLLWWWMMLGRSGERERGRERKIIHNQGFKEHTQRIPAAAVVSLTGRK